MNQVPEVRDILHSDLSQVPMEDVMNVGMNLTNQAIEIIKHSDHCLKDSFRAGEGISPKQYREFSINIGTKPDGRGGVYPHITDNSFINGGVNDIISSYIESSGGRLAQIISKMNVGTSGHFARLLRLNNRDTFIYPDPHYTCNTKNFQEVYISDNDLLYRFENRY